MMAWRAFPFHPRFAGFARPAVGYSDEYLPPPPCYVDTQKPSVYVKVQINPLSCVWISSVEIVEKSVKLRPRQLPIAHFVPFCVDCVIAERKQNPHFRLHASSVQWKIFLLPVAARLSDVLRNYVGLRFTATDNADVRGCSGRDVWSVEVSVCYGRQPTVFSRQVIFWAAVYKKSTITPILIVDWLIDPLV